MTDFETWGSQSGVLPHPYAWQHELASDPECRSRLIRIPTGFGKTLGVLAAWLYNRLERGADDWPRRLVWCLPMRVLVEQTEAEATAVLERLGLLWTPGEPREGRVAVHRLMGGVGAGDYHLWPEELAILIGTQDMLLSRALNRGYAAARGRWPLDFGLLNQDALWVLDEVQLMDVGLATSAQLAAFRQAHDDGTLPWRRPCRSWWMSATLQPEWLQSVDTKAMLASLPAPTEIPSEKQVGGLWDVAKPVSLQAISSDKTLEREVAEVVDARHVDGTLTLVVLNRVETATGVFEALRKAAEQKQIELRLVHSRFRPHERAAWREGFLSRSAPMPSGGRIIVATQVVEAGVDISATTLITDLAPWPSLVQRWGRCARYVGEEGNVVVLDRGWDEDKDEKRALPYAVSELVAAREAVGRLDDVAPRQLEGFERELSDTERLQLYPYQPKHLLLEREWTDLFDTTPDLTGADVDIGRFIRSGEELDVQIFWREVPESGPPADWKPTKEELCAVPFRKAQEWLCGKETKEKRAPKLKPKMRAWVWDWLDGEWKRDTQRADLVPGRVVLVDAACGGYSAVLGWAPDAERAPVVANEPSAVAEDVADDAQDNEELSLAAQWKTIGTHGSEAGASLRSIAQRLGITESFSSVLELAAETHDVGKSIEFFQGSMVADTRPDRGDLAKAPQGAWPRASLYRASGGERRPGLRHELASALALFDVLRRCAPDHPALLGEWAPLLGVDVGGAARESADGAWERRVLALPDRASFDLLVYLVAAHHGKVRLTLHAAPVDQEYQLEAGDDRGLPLRGVREGDPLPALLGPDGALLIGPSTLTLEPAQLGLSEATGPSWTERTLALLRRYGPGTLAWLEALVRAADIRASRLTTEDPALAPANSPATDGAEGVQ